MIKRQHNKYYERKMQYNKVEYCTADCVYCTAHDFKMPFCMTYFSIREIINHCFLVNNYKVESGIGYDMIIGSELMLHLGLKANFKCQFLQWDGTTVHMKEPHSLLGEFNLNKRNMREVVMQTA